MKVVILAGGYGSRLSEETDVKPKPMVEIGDKPILWHLMKIYSTFNHNEFVILLGYKGYVIKEYFANYFLHQSNVTMDLATNKLEVHNNTCEPWKVTLLDTGLETQTGGRIKRARDFLNNEPFMLTYGDGVANIDLFQLSKAHQSHGKAITITAVQPEGRFGTLEIGEDSAVSNFTEKPKGDGTWINGGFFVCENKVIDYIDGDDTIFEQEPLRNLAKDGELHAHKHHGFWKCMDTLRDKRQLDELWNTKQAKWAKWEA